MSFFSEIKRRNVIRVGAAYAVTAWLLIQVAETIFPLFGFSETPARIVVVVLAIGLIPSLVLAWAFEWTPEGLKREAEVDRSLPTAAVNARRLDRIIMAVLALGLGYFAFDKFVLDPARDAALVAETAQQARSEALVESYGEHSIAVLPFDNFSEDPQQEYFSDGMAEELLNLLARVKGLRVISRSSSFAFKGQPINVPTIAEQLGVNHIVEGSVRKFGDRIRITAQLIEARSDTHLWSQTYERRLEDVFAIQDEISAAIVGELQKTLGLSLTPPPAVNASANTEAYEAYLRGEYLMAQRTSDSLTAAVEEFGTAIKLDPDYATGHAAFALATRHLVEYGGLLPAEAESRAGPHVERALELDPELAEAHAASAWLYALKGDKARARVQFRRAIELKPSYAEVYLWLGNLFKTQYSESTALITKAAQLDPLSLPVRSTFLARLVALGRLDEAESELDKLSALDPEGFFYHSARVVIKSLGGNWADGALASLDGLGADNARLAFRLLMYCALMGLESEALVDVTDLGFSLQGDVLFSKVTPVLMLRWLGRSEEAVSAFERTFGQDPQYLYLIYGLALAGAGEYNRAGPFLEAFWEDSGESAGVPYHDSHLVLALQATRRAGKSEADIADLERALGDAVRRYDEAGLVLCDSYDGCVDFDRGISAYLGGRREVGLALISRAIEQGYFIPPNQAYLQFLYDDPGFAQILEAQRAQQLRERAKFLAVVCGDNPYEAVWQPQPETCQTHGMASGD